MIAELNESLRISTLQNLLGTAVCHKIEFDCCFTAIDNGYNILVKI